jgi:hypothetical protein
MDDGIAVVGAVPSSVEEFDMALTPIGALIEMDFPVEISR